MSHADTALPEQPASAGWQKEIDAERTGW